MIVEGTRSEISKIMETLGLNGTVSRGTSFKKGSITFRVAPSAEELLEAIEKCTGNDCCEGCPYDSYEESCSDNMLLDAKRIIEKLINKE